MLFIINLLFLHHIFILSLKLFFLCEIPHVSLSLHHTDSPGKTPKGKMLFTSWHECLGGIVLKELAAL